MKNLILTLVMMMSVSAFADSVGQRTAADMASILSHSEVQSLLAQKDGASNITEMKRVPPMESMSSADYELTFQSTSSFSGNQSCKYAVTVSNQSVTSFVKGNCN